MNLHAYPCKCTFVFEYTHLQLLCVCKVSAVCLYMWRADSDGSMMNLSMQNWCRKNTTVPYEDDLDSDKQKEVLCKTCSGHSIVWEHNQSL